ncbi:MAG: HPP family protein [Magnetococcales bacterium]|nr:HPP family protein [Magnetococcales bacterium]
MNISAPPPPSLRHYLRKMRGGGAGMPAVSAGEIFWSWLGGMLGIGLLAWLHERFFAPADLVLIIGSFGASAVLVYGAPGGPLAQPRNLIGGHIISALVGVGMFQWLGEGLPWLAAAAAVATAIACMHITKTLHPPGGATALIAVIGSPQIHQLGFFYVLVPAGLGALSLLLVALLVNNLAPTRKYPLFWW